MICTRLEGGLGNQLFQYAAGRALAIRHRSELILDCTAYARQSSRYAIREFELHQWSIRARQPTDEERSSLQIGRPPALQVFRSAWAYYVEDGRGYNERFDELPDWTYLRGYWQSHRYFEAHARAIAQEIQPRSDLAPRNMALRDAIDSAKSVAIHVRRGDYVTIASAAKLHGALSASYYTSAIRYIRDRVPQAEFFVFSDDPDWCRSNLGLGGQATYVDWNQGPSAWQDLALMARCKHHVIANSSFSWWGAWLGDQHSASPWRIVVAPRRWFAGMNIEHRDRFLPHWNVIDG